MTAADELRSILEQLKKPSGGKGLFARKKSKNGKGKRRDAALRAAELAAQSAPDAAVCEALALAATEFCDDPAIRKAYAVALLASGKDAEAIAEFEESLRLAPDDADSLTEVALLYERNGREDLALERLRRAVDLYVAGRNLLGAVEAGRRLVTLAPESLEHATDLVGLLRAHDPALLAGALEHLADVYRSREKIGQEADICRELLTIAPERDDFRQRLADIYVRILEVDPNDDDAWLGLATVDEMLADGLSARLAGNASAETDYSNPASPAAESHESYAIRKAQELIDRGDMLGASLCLERAVRKDGHWNNHLQLGRCYRDLHREDAAVEAGLAALASAYVEDDVHGLQTILAWIGGIWPDAQNIFFETAELNKRPVSADIVYDELLKRRDDAQASAGAGAGREAR
jgi:tetratricopeptide (TPR) repeat protein